MRRFLIALTAAATLAACSTDVGSDSSYATDSFRNPTHHGELDFFGSNVADFSSEQNFHGWSFTLTGAATVTLGTELHTANLDTVMYLYNADENGKKFGPNIGKDDNGGEDGISSLLTKELEAGRYFIQVKTANQAMRGRFNVTTACAGVGCPVLEPTGVADYCGSAEESIGKCLDDSLDATLEGCAPSGAASILCCNGTMGTEDEAWYCADHCGSSLMTAREWGADLEPLYTVFVEDDYEGLEDYQVTAVNSCASPDLEALADDTVDSYNVDLEDEGLYAREAWIARGEEGFYDYFISEDVITMLDSMMGESATQRFEASVELSCNNCTDGRTVYGVYYPKAGKLVELMVRWGGDS